MGSAKEPTNYQGVADFDFSQQGAEWKEKARTLGADARELGKITKEIARDAVGSLKGNAVAYYEDGLKHAKSAEKRLEQRIRTKPIETLLIAAGIGLLVGMLCRK